MAPVVGRDEQLEDIAKLLEELAGKLRLLKVTERTERVPSSPPGLRVGQRVLVIQKRSKYRGRKGEILSRHGTMFWNLRLTASAQDGVRDVHLMDEGLQALDDEL